MKKILVTGGAGFIGSNLCEKLVNSGKYKVYSLDNYFTGSKLNHINNVTYFEGNTSEIDIIIDFKIDIVFHLGEYSRVEQSFSEIKTVWEFNVKGTFSVLQFCLKNGCKLIYAGSSTKFGDNGKGKFQSPYAWMKSNNTDLIKNYGIWFNLNYCIVYFYNAYGNREISDGKYATLIAIFKKKYQNLEPLTVVKPGFQIRNFTNVKDIVNALILIGEKGKGDGYGIGHHESYSIIEIAKMFNSKIDYIEERKGNRMTADLITKKTLELGWKPKESIKNYINKIISND